MTNLARKVIKKAGEYKLPVLRIVAVSVLGPFVLWAIFPSISPEWTGFGPYVEEANLVRAKTLWEWMVLLIIPVALAIGVWRFNKSERESERTIAENRQQEARLQTYYDRMTDLLLKEGLRKSKRGDEKRSIARTRTLTTLRTLNGERKGLLLRFLYEANLVGARKTVVILRGADLRGACLRGACLRMARLTEANLSSADLLRADLRGAELHGADLRGADLRRAKLLGADLSMAKLRAADLISADLRGASLRGADLSGATVTSEQLAKTRCLENATMPDGTRYEEWVKGHPGFLEMRDEAPGLQGDDGRRCEDRRSG